MAITPIDLSDFNNEDLLFIQQAVRWYLHIVTEGLQNPERVCMKDFDTRDAANSKIILEKINIQLDPK